MALLLACARALDNGLGLTPPLGYNSYDHLGCCANETTLLQQADALVARGLAGLGYKYVNVDCGWMGGRLSNGTLYEDRNKFPRGMRFVADALHARGLRLGLYSDRGTHCFSGAGLGMKGHEAVDAEWMASVGVDYLKVDDMSGEPRTEAGAAADLHLPAVGGVQPQHLCAQPLGRPGLGPQLRRRCDAGRMRRGLLHQTWLHGVAVESGLVSRRYPQLHPRWPWHARRLLGRQCRIEGRSRSRVDRWDQHSAPGPRQRVGAHALQR